VIVGNPPFLGGKRLRSELGDDYVDILFELYNGRVPREADLVCYWFEKAREVIEKKQTKRAGLLGTQGIRGGANRKVLEKIKETGDIFWAQSDRDWVLDGATVHVSMVGFDSGKEKEFILDDKKVNSINSDLTSTIDLTQAKQLEENLNLSFMGVTPAGPFDIDGNLARSWSSDNSNPNGKPNSGKVYRVPDWD
jgi:type II restriction/modification system DNA methylase subunit YeeA